MKPDYSKIPAMACKCESVEQRDEILNQLIEWGVPLSPEWYLRRSDLWIEWVPIGGLLTFTEDWEEYKEVSHSEFFTKFREVYEASNKPVKAGIVFPELSECTIGVDPAFVPTIIEIIDWHKEQILKLNPHLKQ